MKKLAAALESASTEEEVKGAFIRALGLKAPVIRDGIDLLVDNILFEFKHDVDLSVGGEAMRRVLAQALYYVRAIGRETSHPLPEHLALVDKNEALLYATCDLMRLVDSDKYDWSMPASSPDPVLVDDLGRDEDGEVDGEDLVYKGFIYELRSPGGLKLFVEALQACRSDKHGAARPKGHITGANFEDVYLRWCEVLGFEVQNGVECFLDDIQKNVAFDRETCDLIFKATKEIRKIQPRPYDQFWSGFHRPPEKVVIAEIRQKRDRLRVLTDRRFEGEFYTPRVFAEKAIEYISDVLGPEWQTAPIDHGGKYVWDPACGSGNLLLPLRMPNERVFASTLLEQDVRGLDWLPGATVFQYDFLNDPVEKLPEGLRAVLEKDGGRDLVVLMNPPFAEAGTGIGEGSKDGVANTEIRKAGSSELGAAKRELFAQFFMRLSKIAPEAKIAMFSKLKHIMGPNFAAFRKNVLYRYSIESGFVFNCRAFHGTAGNWPVAFQIWSPEELWATHKCELEVLDWKTGEVIGTKVVEPPVRMYINDWFNWPSCTVGCTPLNGALKIKLDGQGSGCMAPGAFGYASINSSSIQKSNLTFFLSSAYSDGKGCSITPETFEKAMTAVAVRKAIKPTWLNDRDQFMIPHTEPPLEFTINCVVYNLFAGHNQTSEWTAEWDGKKWPIKNEFFPFSTGFLDRTLVTNNGAANRAVEVMKRDGTQTWVYSWLVEHQGHYPDRFSNEAWDVVKAGYAVYDVFFKNYDKLPLEKFKIEGVHPGWYQIRMCLKEWKLGQKEVEALKVAHQALEKLIERGVYVYGFLGE